MPDMEMVLEYEKGLTDIRPEKVLKAAGLTLKVLREIERNLTGKKRPQTGWRVNVYMFNGRAVVTFEGVGVPDKNAILEKTAARGAPDLDLSTP